MNETYQEQEIEIDLREIFALLKSKIVSIVAVTLAAALAGFLFSAFAITPQYAASVDMIVNARKEMNDVLTNDNINSAKNLIPTYALIIKSNTVMNKVISRLDLDMDYEKLAEKISVNAVGTTQVMRITVEDAQPELARAIAEKISDIAPAMIVDTMEAGSCKVIGEVSTSNGPVSPNVKRNTALAAMLGMVAAIGVIVMKELLSNTLVDDEDVQKYLNLPVLGVIPEIEEKR